MSSVQVLERDGRPAFAILPWEEYEKLRADAEMALDVRAYDAAKLEAADQERLPAAMVDQLLDGENPVLVWRRHRALSRGQLATKAGLTAARLGELEEGAPAAGGEELGRLAAALEVEVEDLS